MSSKIPKFPHNGVSLHLELKNKINSYFKENQISPNGNLLLYFKSFLFISLLICLYIHLVFYTPVWYWAILEVIAFGLTIAFIGFNVMHDGSHGSYSKYKIVNSLAACSMSILGADRFIWNVKHNMIHHTYTNINGYDDDIDLGNLLRMSPEQKKLKFHKYQHIYFWFLYMFLYIFWIFFADYNKYFSKKIGFVEIKKMKMKHHLEFWIVKIYHLFVFVVIPIFMVGFLPWLLGFLLACFVAGFVLSIVFQLAHTVETTDFPMPDPQTHIMSDDFAKHQILTTSNFATKNFLINFLTGGLNFQVEHHLFPKVSHIHYPQISKIVKDTCSACGIRYNEYKNFFPSIKAHVRFLKALGQKD